MKTSGPTPFSRGWGRAPYLVGPLLTLRQPLQPYIFAFGEKKIDAIQRLATGNVSEDLPASILHNHPNVEIIVDETIYQAL